MTPTSGIPSNIFRELAHKRSGRGALIKSSKIFSVFFDCEKVCETGCSHIKAKYFLVNNSIYSILIEY